MLKLQKIFTDSFYLFFFLIFFLLFVKDDLEFKWILCSFIGPKLKEWALENENYKIKIINEEGKRVKQTCAKVVFHEMFEIWW